MNKENSKVAGVFLRLMDIEHLRNLLHLEIDPSTLHDRIYGGWLGRVAGCVLGKPVEPWGPAYHPAHAINNTVWLVLALLYGNGDFEKTICTAVLCGFDTDCNGANAGTVMGVLAGAQTLPHKWIDPLEDTLKTAIAGYGNTRISNLAHSTATVAGTCFSYFQMRSE